MQSPDEKRNSTFEMANRYRGYQVSVELVQHDEGTERARRSLGTTWHTRTTRTCPWCSPSTTSELARRRKSCFLVERDMGVFLDRITKVSLVWQDTDHNYDKTSMSRQRRRETQTLKAPSRASIASEMYDVDVKCFLCLTASSAIGVCIVHGTSERTTSVSAINSSSFSASAGLATSRATALQLGSPLMSFSARATVRDATVTS